MSAWIAVGVPQQELAARVLAGKSDHGGCVAAGSFRPSEPSFANAKSFECVDGGGEITEDYVVSRREDRARAVVAMTPNHKG